MTISRGLATSPWSALPGRVLVAALLGILASAAANPTWYQRYVDFPLLLAPAGLAVTTRGAVGRIERLCWLLAGFL